MLVYAYNPSCWEVEAGELEVKGPQLHSEFKTSLSYMKPSLPQRRREYTQNHRGFTYWNFRYKD